jgi:hypothetical protein
MMTNFNINKKAKMLIATSEICGFSPSSFEDYVKELEQDCILSLVTHEKDATYTNVSKVINNATEWVKSYKNNKVRRVKSADEILNRINEIEKGQINKSKFRY